MALPLTSTQQSKGYRCCQTVENPDLKSLAACFPAVLMHTWVYWLKTEEWLHKWLLGHASRLHSFRVSRSPLSPPASKNHTPSAESWLCRQETGDPDVIQGTPQGSKVLESQTCDDLYLVTSIPFTVFTNTSCCVSDGLGSQISNHLLRMSRGTGTFPGLPLRQIWDVPLAYNCNHKHESIPVFSSVYAIYSFCPT